MNYECDGKSRIIPTDKLIKLSKIFSTLKHFAQKPDLLNIFFEYCFNGFKNAW
jgi:hypothetical protein